MAEHVKRERGAKPWLAQGISRASWYRRQAESGTVSPSPSVSTVSPASPVSPPRLVSSQAADWKRPKISLTAAGRFRGKRELVPRVNPFAPAPLPPFAPKAVKAAGLAMDDSLQLYSNWAFGTLALAKGLAWPGFGVLSELAQQPETMQVSATIAEEVMRKGFTLQASGNEDLSEQIGELQAELDRLQVNKALHDVTLQDGLFGRSHIFLDFGDADARELLTDIGDGSNETSAAKVARDSLKRLQVVEPFWIYPLQYNSTQPHEPFFYQPQTWGMVSTQVHVSRLLLFVGHELPDILKPAYQFAGLSRTQMVEPAVKNWYSSRQAVNDLLRSFTIFNLATDMAASLQDGGEDFDRRIGVFADCRDNRGVLATNKDTEELKNISAPLGGLSELQAQAQEHMASVARIPLVKLLGISPSGLQATSEFELKVFYDHVAAFQQKFLAPNLTKIIRFAQLSLWGYVNPCITFRWEPLGELDAMQLATVKKTKADTAQVLIDSGVVSQEEVRRAVAADPESDFPGLDIENVPDLRAEEEAGLAVPGARLSDVEEEEE